MENSAEARPWQTAPIPRILHQYQCPGPGWHDMDFDPIQLIWYEGDDHQPAGWLCQGCHYRALSYLFGHSSPELRSLHDKLESKPNLLEELERRAELDMAG